MGPKKTNNDFRWTDDEIQLLLQTCLEYKTKEEYKGFSWESIRNKYENIREILVENYPRDEVDKEKYPNAEKIGEVLTKDRISAKLKIIRADFRKAIDKGKRSGGGRVVFTFFDLCEQLWGGSPAVTAIENSRFSRSTFRRIFFTFNK